ncbi:VOC family protein [Undibacterium sp. LX40W]|uniref:VOC family protein n=1 Tax=Undibacterium nitidum TaxID=2762298 RepID=A0A923HJY9_9BURK|nr:MULTISPECIES: VOC family protein [Undibacterium]MBC3881050.1 VOC family protein [Undibacterium nitidum]MBC3890217.1 VOC family protein [Undibacterium sp. LX40W]
MSLQVLEIGQIAIAVNDIDKARAFYRDVLGLPFLFDAPPAMSFLMCGSVRLMLTTLQGDPADHRTSSIYYKVADLSHADQQLHKAGIAWERPPALVAKMADHDLWMGFVRDPDHNLIGLMEERRS